MVKHAWGVHCDSVVMHVDLDLQWQPGHIISGVCGPALNVVPGKHCIYTSKVDVVIVCMVKSPSLGWDFVPPPPCTNNAYVQTT